MRKPKIHYTTIMISNKINKRAFLLVLILSVTGLRPAELRHYSVNDAYALSASGNYAATGQLSVMKTTDEGENASYTFTHKLERLPLKRRLAEQGENRTDSLLMSLI